MPRRLPATPRRTTVQDLLARARSRLQRADPRAAAAEVADGALLIDVRTDDQRREDGEIPGALPIALNVLEWRADPDGEHRDPRIGGLDCRLLVICDQGYSSSLAAARLQDLGFAGATDVVGGFQAWRSAGLPVEARPAEG